jgi:hypothetical protein
MSHTSLAELQASIQNKEGYTKLRDYPTICEAFLTYINEAAPTRVTTIETDKDSEDDLEDNREDTGDL